MFEEELKRMRDELRDCAYCPWKCHVDRTSGTRGVCGSGAGFQIGAIVNHHGEEPVFGGEHGICNVFFSRCNLRCIYCQNYEISRNRGPVLEHDLSLEEIVIRIERILRRGVAHVGFVSPSHMIPQMRAIISALRRCGYHLTFVMNTGGYDSVETLRMLAGDIDVYLPDFKYMDPELAWDYSGASNYPKVALAAIKEMVRQTGITPEFDADGFIRRGVIIRHLVLPGAVDNSVRVLRTIAREISPDVYISLMAQYHPTPLVATHPFLSRTITPEEYAEVLAEAERLGFRHGFIQELDSAGNYLPEFSREHPFM